MPSQTITSADAFSLVIPNATVLGGVVFGDLASPVGQVEDVPVVVTATGSFPTEGNLALVDASGGAVQLTLPPGSDALIGKRYSITKTENSVNDVQLVPSGTDTIEGASALSAGNRYSRRDVVWLGGMWRRAGTVLSSANFLTTTGNLVGISDPKVARQAIGANDHLLCGEFSSVVGASSEVSRRPWPYPGSDGNAFLIRLDAVLGGTTDGTVVITVSIGGVPAVPVLTLPAGAAGDRGSINFSAGNSIPADSVIDLTISGTNTLDVPASFTLKAII